MQAGTELMPRSGDSAATAISRLASGLALASYNIPMIVKTVHLPLRLQRSSASVAAP